MDPVTIVVEPINFTDINTKNSKILWINTKLELFSNGLKLDYEDTIEETGYIKENGYPGFAPAKFFKAKDRNYIKVNIDPEQQACLNFKNKIIEYESSLEKNSSIIFGKFDKFYALYSLIKVPQAADELEAESLKKNTIKFESIKVKLNQNVCYYYNNELLNYENTKIINTGIIEIINAPFLKNS